MDEFDRIILGFLAMAPRRTSVIAKAIAGDNNSLKYRSAYEKVKYRLLQMKEKGIVTRNNKTGEYSLIDVSHGDSVVHLFRKDGKLEELIAGETIFIHLKEGTMVVFIEETCDRGVLKE